MYVVTDARNSDFVLLIIVEKIQNYLLKTLLYVN